MTKRAVPGHTFGPVVECRRSKHVAGLPAKPLTVRLKQTADVADSDYSSSDHGWTGPLRRPAFPSHAGRLGSSFASGLPLGLVWYAIPDWMRDVGVDIRLVGLLTLAQAPWSFKVLWSPLMDRYVPPFWGRRRGWMAVTQLLLGVLVLMLAGVGERPEALWIVGALAFAIAIASASQDIAIDAYAVEVLRREEQGAAVGARLAFYRAAMLVSGGVSITLAARIGWPAVNGLLAIVFVLMLALTWRSPEPDVQPAPPSTLRDAVWLPLAGDAAPAPRARNPGLRRAVQAWRSVDPVAHETVSHRHGVRRLPSRRRAGDAHRVGSRSSARSPVGSSPPLRGSATRSGCSASCRSSRTPATSCSRCWSGPTSWRCTVRPVSRSSPRGWGWARSACCCSV